MEMFGCKDCGGLFYSMEYLKHHKKDPKIEGKSYCEFGFKWCNKVLRPSLPKNEQMKCGTWSFGSLMTCDECWGKYSRLNPSNEKKEYDKQFSAYKSVFHGFRY